MKSTHPSRRTFLRAAGVSLALPVMDSLTPRSARAATNDQPIQRMVYICTTLGLHAPYLFPEEDGHEYSLTQYLEQIGDHRQDFTLFSGLSHPDQTGRDGHSSSQTWLTAATHPGLPGFKNTISVDQLLAERIGLATRFPSIQLSTSGSCQSCSRSGITLQSESIPSRMFARLFVEGTKEEKQKQIQKLREGGSVLDAVRDEARRLGKQVAEEDRQTLAEYFQSVRETEKRLLIAEEWIHKPKPKVDAAQPTDIEDQKDTIGRMKLLFDLIPLIVQTDSTRLITVVVEGRNDVPPINGVSMDHHNLSHHGKDDRKLKELKLIETLQFKALAELLASMKSKTEAGSRLIDNTAILFGSNLGNANSHDTRNLPILLAGGPFKHGRHIRLNAERNTPLSNLFVQTAAGIAPDLERFGTSTSATVPGFV